MIKITAYTKDLDNKITFRYTVEDHEVERLVADLKKENLAIYTRKA
jgi:hypothetical protein